MNSHSIAQNQFADNQIFNEQTLRDANCSVLSEGADFLNELPPELFQKCFTPIFQSTIGAHFRHILEHYRCFFAQLKGQTFNYDARERDIALEQNYAYACSTIKQIYNDMQALEDSDQAQQFYVLDHYASAPIETNVSRELAFLQSHTVHHFAIIAAIARGLGQETQEDFGVAIATRCHQQALAGD